MEPAALGLSPKAARGTCETHRWPDGLKSLCSEVGRGLCGEPRTCIYVEYSMFVNYLHLQQNQGPELSHLPKCAPELPTVASRSEQVNRTSFILGHND